jgi:hypothetical protein
MKPITASQSNVIAHVVVWCVSAAAVYWFVFPLLAFIFASKQPINPDIYPAIRAAEERCNAETYPERTVKCAKLATVLSQCATMDAGCSPTAYYGDMVEFGFDLPPLYQSSR